jgi:hypothetical protein
MKKYILALIGVWIMSVPVFSEEDWSVEADVVDSCSCSVICPCIFGSDPTNRECLGQHFTIIKKGHYGKVDLSGLRFHTAYKMGSWERYTVAPKATPEQMKALRTVVEKAFVLPGGKITSFKKGPVKFSRKDGVIKFSAPGSEVELETVAGSDGKPIRIPNHPIFQNYQQFRSVKNSHKSENAEFSVSNTNGLAGKQSHSSTDS